MKHPILSELSPLNISLIKKYFEIYDMNLSEAIKLETSSGVHINLDEILKDQIKSCSELVDNELIVYTIELIKYNFSEFYQKYQTSFIGLMNHKVDETLENF